MPQNDDLLRGEPHSVDAERTTLGTLLLDPERITDVAPTVQPEDFYDPVYRTIYTAIRDLHEKRTPIDFVTVADALKTDEKIQSIGGSAFLMSLVKDVPTSAHGVHYAAIVREKAMHRELLRVGAAITKVAGNEKLTAIEALEFAEQALLKVSRNSTDSKPQHIGDVGIESYERYVRLNEAEDKSALRGLASGFRDVDNLVTEFSPGNLIVVAARPSMGKSSLALDIARHAAAVQGKNVAVFSLEMTKQEIMDRIIAGFLGVNAWRLKKGQLTPDDFDRMGKLFDQLKTHPLYIDDDPDTTISNLRSKARRQQMEHGLDLLVIDYLQLIETTDRASGENRTQQVSHISRSLKNLGRELGVPIIALSQLSRAAEQRNPPIPILSDLRDSGTIEQDADIVLMLYRQGMYDEDCESPDETDVYVRKNRNGPTGRATLNFDKAKMSFSDLARPPRRTQD
jgi:replicative DNA helicase